MFIPSALEHNHFIPITAVILRTRQDQGIHHIVNYLHKYPFIKELYIYNLLPSHPLHLKVRQSDGLKDYTRVRLFLTFFFLVM